MIGAGGRERGAAGSGFPERHRPVGHDGGVGAVGEARQGLVEGVGDDCLDQLVEPVLAGVADIHRRPCANAFNTFEGPNLILTVIALRRVIVLCRFVHVLVQASSLPMSAISQ